LLEIVEKEGNLNIQTQTPVTNVGEKDADGYITVETGRGKIKAKAVIHATVS
jgi:glycine/D-amino acid oxidase-like deaminating enzyme